MIKLTIIIPVYKVEKYIEKCARSLFEQTLSDIEYIFVDDCSPDRSVEIIRGLIEIYRLRFAEERKVVRIESMPTNSGQAAVRRHGMLLASGEYVIHCDGDDWVDTDLYEKMYNKAKEDGADVVMCDFVYEYSKKQVIRKLREIHETGKQIVQSQWQTPMHFSLCNKMVKKSLHEISMVYPIEGVDMWEDNCVMYRLLYYVGKVSQIRNSYYHYNKNNQISLSASYGNKAINQMIKCSEIVSDFYHNKIDANDYKETVLFLKYYAKLSLITDSYEKLRTYNRIFPESNCMIKYIPYSTFSTKGKIRFWFVKHHLAWLFILMFKAKNLVA
ncbi:MAG: glycosyltransferase [Bacteroidaceae bacterium]|nr:glycosyltransferase [Bacteroidaceae bacterium]